MPGSQRAAVQIDEIRQPDCGDEKAREEPDWQLLSEADNRARITHQMRGHQRDRDHERNRKNESIGPEHAADNPDCKRQRCDAEDREDKGDRSHKSQRREKVLEGNEQPAIERGVFRNECDIRHVAGGGSKHVVDLIQVVVNERHVIDCSYRTKEVEKTAGDHDHRKSDANSPWEASRTQDGPEDDHKEDRSEGDDVAETLPVAHELGALYCLNPEHKATRREDCERDIKQC